METNSLPLEFEPLDVNGLGEMPELSQETILQSWHSAQALVSPNLAARRDGLEQLLALQVFERSPLLIYLLATCITEPDIDLRRLVVRSLAQVLDAGPMESQVFVYLTAYLSQMRTRQIYALLQLAASDSEMEPAVTRLLSVCSFAGNQLSAILLDRQVPLEIRRQAVRLVGQIGYLDAVTALERLQARLESKMPPQQSLAALEIDAGDELNLLPLLQEALAALRAP